MCLKIGINIRAPSSRGTISIIFYVYKVCLCVCRFESATVIAMLTVVALGPVTC